MLVHTLFDVLSFICALLTGVSFRRHYALSYPNGIQHDSQHHYYLITLLLGMVLGSIVLGTLNVYLAGKTGIAKSMLGGIFGAIVAAEIFKYFVGIRQSTGLYFVPSLIVLIIVGRIGCFLSGLPDFTYGTPTALPWGVDFGDGIARHPVQLYESITMTIFLMIFLLSYRGNLLFWNKKGFYVFVLIYAGQRFLWEFIKPYPIFFGGLGLFQWLCLVLIGYALLMLRSTCQELKHGE